MWGRNTVGACLVWAGQGSAAQLLGWATLGLLGPAWGPLAVVVRQVLPVAVQLWPGLWMLGSFLGTVLRQVTGLALGVGRLGAVMPLRLGPLALLRQVPGRSVFALLQTP